MLQIVLLNEGKEVEGQAKEAFLDPRLASTIFLTC